MMFTENEKRKEKKEEERGTSKSRNDYRFSS